ncbi:star-related lipid transfer protein 13 isoform x3 [Limosa lapponica baueri]|uniref:Star-related lipid transfer protein 13 isoform x3 n=1 Tax=Limosa lapponica baueri TaxID=1758121 RepID=A0A2I0UC09_LIMLA|nr:star-related lipid transfer protein 13 isoform x3 [Limosa lapponica baueri]
MSSQRRPAKAQLRRSLSEQLRDSTAKAWDLLWRNVRERRLAGCQTSFFSITIDPIPVRGRINRGEEVLSLFSGSGMPKLVIKGREENVMCTLFLRTWASTCPDAMEVDLSSVLDSVPSLRHGTAMCQAGWSCTLPGMLAATRLNSVCFIREMGEVEVERVTALLQRASLPGTPSVAQTPTTHQPKPQLSWVSRKSNQQRDGFAVPSGCLGGDGLGIVEKQEIF